ncbi:MAG TPA: FlgD immunoglobulin-like domain containing protein [Oleiagrimonas sp.]|nr:FlgD immunoglobulin-like domain containing protein [Oleiagrimonas sp.]
MNDLNGVTGSSSPLTAAATLSGQQLTQQDFLKLMVEQYRAQDPTKPMDSTQFVGQLAQFSQIAATQQMQTSFDQLATSLQSDQVLRASDLIGRQVLVPSSHVAIGGGTAAGVTGAVNVPGASDDVRVSIADANGNTVRTIDLGAQPGGLAGFQWDGLDADGKPVPAGLYTLSAGSANAPLTTYVGGQVAGIDTTSTGANLLVDGVGDVSLNQIAQIL